MKYLRLLSRLEGACLFISEAKLRVITEKVTLPLMLGEPKEIDRLPINSLSTASRSGTTLTSSPVGVIEVFDSLVSKSASAASGMTSYQSISSQIDEAVASGYSTLVFNVDSHGGEALGLFSLTNKIRGLQSKGIRTIGFTDGMATSAAYAILAACQETYATETSIVGSIATIMVHVETSEGDRADGKTYTIFRSKSEKALGDSHTPLTDDARAKIQTLLDTMDTAFNNDISTSRNLSVKQIVDFKGAEFMAKQAKALGLIDKIVKGFDDIVALSLKTKSNPRGMKTMNESQKDLIEVEVETPVVGADLLEEKSVSAGTVLEVLEAKPSVSEQFPLAAKSEFISYLQTASALRLDLDTITGILLDSDSIKSATSVMKQVAKFSSRQAVISGSADLQPTLNASTEDQDSATKVKAAVAAYKKATGAR